MTYEELSELTDQELRGEAKKMKTAAWISAFLIGFAFGVVVYGVAKSYIGFFALIPLGLAFKFFHKPADAQKNEAVKKLIEERGL